jgi:hypothetical protein
MARNHRAAIREDGYPTTSHPPGQPQSVPLYSLSVRSYQDIKVNPITWLWKNRLAFGKFSLFAGVPGAGKTYAMCDLVARCSQGGMFPDGTPVPHCESLILSAEDGAEDTLKPRLLAHNADMNMVHHLDGVRTQDRDLFFAVSRYTDLLDKWLDGHPHVRLIAIDPITAFMGDDVDDYKNAEVRAALGPLAAMADQRKITILGITHLSKSQTKSINRVIGSIAYVAAARAVWLIDHDPNEHGRRLFLQIKNNLGHADGLAFSINPPAPIAWESDPVTMTADDLSDTTHTTSQEAAVEWLRDSLSDGPVSARQILSQCEREGISKRTLGRAKKALKVISKHKESSWFWMIPE